MLPSRNKLLLFSFVVLVIASSLYFRNIGTKAAGNIYYFNNAVNTSPTTLGNYWYDENATDPALELPDLATDPLHILPGATYAGNAIFNDADSINEGIVTGTAIFYTTAQNNGTVNGQGTFYGDSLNNITVDDNAFFYDSSANVGTVTGNAVFFNDSGSSIGTVLGTKTRKYNIAYSPGHDFITDGPWTVIADGVVVNLSQATFNGATTFSTVNGGSFIYIQLSEYYVQSSTITLIYSTNLDSTSTPSTSDYIVRVNNNLVSISGVNVSGTNVVLTLTSAVTMNDVVIIDYTSGTNPVRRMSGYNVSNISSLTMVNTATLGTAPYYSLAVGNKLYVANINSTNVSIIDSVSGSVIATPTVGTQPYYFASIGNKVYVTNNSSNTVSAIDTASNAVTATISVGNSPYYILAVGVKLYVINRISNTVSVIDSTTNTVTATIAVGSTPLYGVNVGTKLYVANSNGNTVSVIDTTTNTVSATITVGTGPVHINAIGTKVYVINRNSHNVSVIDTLTNTVTATVAIGTTPFYSVPVGSKLYVANFGSNTVSVIDSATSTVSATINVGTQPSYIISLGDRVYVGNLTSQTVSIINTVNNTVTDTIPMKVSPIFLAALGSRVYVSNNISNKISVIDSTSVPSQLPNLLSFSSSIANGTYTAGQQIPISAQFGRPLASGSTMTLALNSGASIILNSVSGSTLQGTYTVAAGESTPDLSVSSITSASVTDTSGHTRTNYSLPSSQGDFVAENSFITRNLGDSKNIIIGSYRSITVGSKPYQISTPITVGGIDYLYVANQGDNTVSVIRKSDDALFATIPVGSEPYGLTTTTVSGTTYVYVANTGSNTVSVINTATNTVVATITVGVKPYYVANLGSSIYVTNSQSNTVSVINTATNTVSATIPVGSYPRGIKAYSTFLYVANYGDPNYSGGNSISVINSATNTVSATIILPAGSSGPRGVAVLGTKVYVTNYRSNNVSVIDTATNTITNTITVGTGPRGVVGLGSKVYVENFDDGTISVIDTGSNTVTATITVGHSPAGMAIDGTMIYFTRFQDGLISILNTTANTLKSAPPVLSNINATPLTPSTEQISWTSDKNSDSLVEYGTTTSYGSSVYSASAVTNHIINLSGLSRATTYHYRVTSVDSESNTTTSADQTFIAFGGSIGIIGPHPIQIDPSPLSPVAPPSSEEIISDTVHSPLPNLGLLDRLKSKIFLAVEDMGTLWYENPRDGLRYKIETPSALTFLKTVSLGITNDNLNRIPEVGSTRSPGSLSERLKNFFLLQTEHRGQTWFVDPTGYRRFVTASNLLDMSQQVMLGALNSYLENIKIGNTK